jgi:surface polysaccharide O-acyltransferase-like enzyme
VTVPAPPVGALSTRQATDPPQRLFSLDVVRVVTLVGVVTVHAVSVTVTADSVSGGALLSVAHVNRSVFIGLSGFVLAYRAGPEPIPARAFWRRRYVLVVVPYVVWTAVYVLADGSWGTPLSLLGRFVADVSDGGARYHLYFLLLTFQLYAVYPWALSAIRRVHPWRLLAASVTLQMVFSAGTRWWPDAPGVVGTVLSHPGSWLWSYQCYVVAGVLAALHHESVTTWVAARTRLIVAASAVAVAGGLGSYFVQVELFSVEPATASEVFQPSVTVVALVAMVAVLAFGVSREQRRTPRCGAIVRSLSESSFGVYLAHPLVLQGVVSAAGAAGLSAALAGVPAVWQLALVVAVLVPCTYAAATLAVGAARRTPLSLMLTGRRGRHRGRQIALPIPNEPQGAFHGFDLSRLAAPRAQTPG